MRIITFGTYDLFHIGHLNILKNCKQHGGSENTLIVGVSSDELNYSKKQKNTAIPLHDRMEIVRAIKYVDEVFVENSLEEKLNYCIEHKADLLIMGSDHVGRFDFLKNHKVDVLYLPRTEEISTTEIKESIILNKQKLDCKN